jgi:Pentapeptide repeats (8 copies)
MANQEHLQRRKQGVQAWNTGHEYAEEYIDLSGADLSGAILHGVDFHQTNLSDANLHGATLTDAWLWETQRTGWSMQGITCEAAYWDRDRQQREAPVGFQGRHGSSVVSQGVFTGFLTGSWLRSIVCKSGFIARAYVLYGVYKTPGIPHEPCVKLATSSIAVFDRLTW